jgi:Imidazolonepropionase and related amidohydrolases
MSGIVLLCGRMFDGVSETLSGPMEILVEENRITTMGRTVERPPGAEVIDLMDRTVSPWIHRHSCSPYYGCC